MDWTGIAAAAAAAAGDRRILGTLVGITGAGISLALATLVVAAGQSAGT